MASGVAVSFRVDSPPEGEEVYAGATSGALGAGECEVVSCEWLEIPVEQELDLYVIVDPADGGEDEGLSECHEDNNRAAGQVRCPPAVF